jgi:hypothetical protein
VGVVGADADEVGRARDVRDSEIIGVKTLVAQAQAPYTRPSESMSAFHQPFRDVGRRWEDLVHWQTLTGWGAFLGGIGVLLWGIGSISHHQMKVYRGLREQGALESAANQSLADRARALVGR